VSTLLLSEKRQTSKWCRPGPEFLQLNTDGAYLEQSGEGGWGFVIRDHLGAVHKAGVGREYYLQNAFHAEVLGCLEGLKVAASMGMARVVLETDAFTMRNPLEGDDYRMSTLGVLIAEAKHLMASEFVLCEVRYCPRVCNKLAHELASIGCKLPSSSHAIWEDVPHFLEESAILLGLKSNESSDSKKEMVNVFCFVSSLCL
jgi:hypothetical protein